MNRKIAWLLIGIMAIVVGILFGTTILILIDNRPTQHLIMGILLVIWVVLVYSMKKDIREKNQRKINIKLILD